MQSTNITQSLCIYYLPAITKLPFVFYYIIQVI